MQSSKKNECVLCCREITIYATGICDHPVCFECSARMRVLCETNECPICRSDMPWVVFTHKPCTYSEVFRKYSIRNNKYHIEFEDTKAKDCFELLLLNSCPECPEQFPNFEKLKEHVRRKHELHYCDLCSNSLKIFSFERKCYNRQDLGRHKRKGDPDNTSHRGHPICEFCDMRYVDHDELFRHVRRDHFFCHFCDADGLHQYYKSYDYLKIHFRTDHYLCEEGDCVNEKFTAVFRTEIDLKAHKATQHSKNKTKAEARQQRVIEFEFNYVPHARPTGSSSSPRGRRFVQQKRNMDEQMSNDRNLQKNQPEVVEPLNTHSTQEFPYLSEDSVNNSSVQIRKPPEPNLNLQSFGRSSVPPVRRNNMMSAEDFPALGSSTAPDGPTNTNRKLDSSIQKQSNTPIGLTRLGKKNEPTQTTEKPENKHNGQNSKWNSKKEHSNFEENFPKLETKRVPLAAAAAPYLETKASSILNHSASVPIQSNTADDTIQNSEDQFVIIKSKTKKKKHKVPVTEEEELEEKNIVSSISTFNHFSNLNNQENKDPFMPSLPFRPPSVRESDTWESKISFRTDDFPPLEVKKPPPGLNIKLSRAPPPGFKPSSTSSVNSKSSLSMSSIAKIVENSLKNNNSGPMNGIHEQSHSKWNYKDPPNSKIRNEKLIDTIEKVCGTSEKFNEFKTVSRNFRCNNISASNYHSKCLDILGDENFQDIFPELISLLPDIAKQQDLLAVHNAYLSGLDCNVKRRNKFKPKHNIQPCKVCNQVLIEDDYKRHECTSLSY